MLKVSNSVRKGLISQGALDLKIEDKTKYPVDYRK